MHDSNVSKGTPQNPVPQNQLLVQMCVETEVSFVPSTPPNPLLLASQPTPPPTLGVITPSKKLVGVHLDKKKLHPGSLTWNLKINPWKRRFLLETIILRFHVKLWGCTGYQASPQVWPLRLLPAADSAGTRRLPRRAAPTAAATARRVAVVLAGVRGARRRSTLVRHFRSGVKGFKTGEIW